MDNKVLKCKYYEVALALPAVWKNNIYTYSCDEQLKLGEVVVAPFGSKDKIGYIASEIDKPKFDTKSITKSTNIILPKKTLELIDWLKDYYPGTPGVHVQHFIPSFIKTIKETGAPDKTESKSEQKNIPALTSHQKKAYQQLKDNPKTSVLHGITGSGKTRTYSELISDNLKDGKNVLVLYPEISLTSQLEQTLKSYFGDETVSVYHSRRTPTEQKNAWLSSYNKQTGSIIMGPRSALFMTHHNLGLIIIDEAHDSSFKQDSGTHYNGLIVAGALAKQHGAKLILGSATPPIAETHQILSKGGQIVCLHELATKSDHGISKFTVVDMTDKKNRSKSQLLSKQLLENIDHSLSEANQSLLFLNRRGTARVLLCESCGWHVECPNCEMPLTYHHDTYKLQCHICGYSKKAITQCGNCQDTLSQKTPGTKAIEQELASIFPSAKIARFDSDNKKKESFSENFEAIKSGEVDILLGTQLITKGLDLPKLDCVGVLQADSALLLPDYTSEERSFQQLTQVSGRVGRGHNQGKVIIQTYQPNSYIFDYVAKQDWHGFYDLELRKRKESYYPPFSFVLKIWANKKTREKAQKSCEKLILNLKDRRELRILGPAPSYYEKSGDSYAWQIIIMASSRNSLKDVAGSLPSDFQFDLDPISLL